MESDAEQFWQSGVLHGTYNLNIVYLTYHYTVLSK